MTKINAKSERAIVLPRGVKGIHRVIDFLDVLGEHPSGLTLIELCTQLKLPKSTVHRILYALLDRQYVRETLDHGKYALGYEILKLSKACQAGLNFIQEARPILVQLNQTIDENVILAVLDKPRHQIIYLDKLDSSKTVRLASHIGEIAPIHCTALGKALLSGFSDEEILQILSDYELKRLTERTITDTKTFLAEIDKARRQGYSVDIQEFRSEVNCVAAPICNGTGKPIAAVGVSAPATRLDQSRSEQMGHLVVETAKQISELIEYVPMEEPWS